MYNKVIMNAISNLLSLDKEREEPQSSSNIISILGNKTNDFEIEQVQELKNEITLPTDHLDAIKRKVLIGIKAFGIYQPTLIAGYAGISSRHYDEVMNDSEIIEILKNPDIIPCLTKGEILAMLSVEAQNSPKGADRISAMKLLMEFRGLTAPEGAAKSFARIVGKFKR